MITAILQHGIDSGEVRPATDLTLTDLLVSPLFVRILVSGTAVGPELAAPTVYSVLRGVVAKTPGCVLKRGIRPFEHTPLARAGSGRRCIADRNARSALASGGGVPGRC